MTTPVPQDHTYPQTHPPSNSVDAITKVQEWAGDGTAEPIPCSEYQENATQPSPTPAPTSYAAAAAAATPAIPTQQAAHASANTDSPHTPHTNTYKAKPSPCQAPTIYIDNFTQNHTRAEIEIQLRKQFPGKRYALSFLKKGGISIVAESPKETNSILKREKWDESFFGEDLYIHFGKDDRPWLCVNKVPLGAKLAKIREGISKIDPPVGIKNWDSKPEGTLRKLNGTFPTTLVLFKVRDDLIAKNILGQEISIDGKQHVIREFLDSTVLRCTRCQELGSHLSSNCSNPKKCVRCAGPDCEPKQCKTGKNFCANCGNGHSAAHKSCPAYRTNQKNRLIAKKQETYTKTFNSQQKDQMGEINVLKDQISEIAQLKSSILALEKSVDELKQKNNDYEKKMCELVTYSIFHTKMTRNQDEICHIVRREATKIFGNPTDTITDFTISSPTSQVTSNITSPIVNTQSHRTMSSPPSPPPTRNSDHRAQSQPPPLRRSTRICTRTDRAQSET